MLEDVLAAATTAADGAEDTAAAALKNRDLYDQDQLQPGRIAAQQAEKLAHGLSRESARLKERLDSSDYLAKQQIVINAAKTEMERAQNTWDTALGRPRGTPQGNRRPLDRAVPPSAAADQPERRDRLHRRR
ncbi:hypothetical protein ACFC3O_29160 [Streptomyces sp. NPDC056007]|uniref:hypothetical protein n=1 Tax=Streptomyces sp. NPDC056007 TaxID=3345678 RepID=UPI0035E02268